MVRRTNLRWLGMLACFASTMIVAGLAGLLCFAVLAAAGGR